MLKIQPNLPLSTEKLNKPNSNDDSNNLGFMAIFQSIQPTEGKLLNLDGLLNQTIKKDVLTYPKLKNILEKLPQNILSEFNKLLGQPVKKILSDSSVTPEAKSISLIIASLQMNSKQNELEIPKGTISVLVPKTNNENKTPKIENENLIKASNTATELNSASKAELIKATDFLGMKKEVGVINSNFLTPSKEAVIIHPTFINKSNMKTLTNEPQSYGEFKLERPNLTVIQLSATDTPEQTQQNFLKQIETILKSARFSQIAKNHSQMTIQLNPKNLGYMTIKVEQVNKELVARIVTSSSSTKELLESNLHHLNNLNIQVDKFEVNIQQQNNPFLQDGEQSHQQRNQQGNNPKQDDDTEQSTQSFEEQLAKIMP